METALLYVHLRFTLVKSSWFIFKKEMMLGYWYKEDCWLKVQYSEVRGTFCWLELLGGWLPGTQYAMASAIEPEIKKGKKEKRKKKIKDCCQ